DRHIVAQRPEESRQVGAVARSEEHLRRAANVPGRVPAHRLIALHTNCIFGCDSHGHGCSLRGINLSNRAGRSWETVVMWPAPMVTMTSPSRMTSFSDSARSSTFSTNSGSTRPRLRTALQ